MTIATRAAPFLRAAGSLLVLSLAPSATAAQAPASIWDAARTIGPSTEAVVLSGYRERTEPHQLRYVSVSSGSDATGDGSRERPWKSIGHALASAVDARLGNRYAVLVAAGTYREPTLRGVAHVDLWGGFDPANWEREIHRHRTVLDGEGERRILIAADASRLDGFVFTRGAVRGTGGAVLADGVSPSITNSVFVDNRTLQPDDWEPEFLHELANDGGAIAAVNGAAPEVRNSIFAFNSTETGRGGAIAAHNRAAPTISASVFVHNTAGTRDPMRSSDGGAISAVRFSRPRIERNVIAGNRAISTNDGGGIFVELWSSASIEDNLIVGNHGDDDGGGLFMAGQQHHYITELDPVPPPHEYLNLVRGNVFMGNRTNLRDAANNGVMRITNDARLRFEGNLVAFNHGGVDFRRTDLEATRNTIIAPILIREADRPARLDRSVLAGELTRDSDVRIERSLVVEAQADWLDANFARDGASLQIAGAEFDEVRIVTRLRLRGRLPKEIRPGRVVRAEDAWSVVQSAEGGELVVWGRLSAVDSIEILPTLTPLSSSPILSQAIGHTAAR